MMWETKKDLIVLVADLDAEQAIKHILERHHSLGIRTISFDVIRHPDRDPGCCQDSHNLLRTQLNRYKFALVIFDHHGSGRDKDDIDDIQNDIEKKLSRNGWLDENVCVIVLDPELEIWVWATSKEVDQCLGWTGKNPDLRTWLKNKKLLQEDQTKPQNPKEAMIDALKVTRKRHNAVIFASLASRISLNKCTDKGFLRLKTTLRQWFSE